MTISGKKKKKEIFLYNKKREDKFTGITSHKRKKKRIENRTANIFERKTKSMHMITKLVAEEVVVVDDDYYFVEHVWLIEPEVEND